MIWAITGLAALALIRRFWGVRTAFAAAVLIWLAGLVWLSGQAGAEERLRAIVWWVIGGVALLVVTGYGALLSRMRCAAQLRVTAEPGTVGQDGSARAAADPTVTDPSTPLSDAELDRYARHIVLREVGGAGQRRLRSAKVLVVGAGGLGAPVLQYLAAAGIGQITVADDDTVGLSNLQRQVIFSTADLGRPKVQAAADAIRGLNPHIRVTALARRITAKDSALIAEHDLVLDGTDSFAARTAVNAACVVAGVPLIAGAIAQWEGQVTLYDPARGGPCLACLFPDAPAPGLAPPCAEAGIVGALPGVVGSMMALEAIKLLSGVADSGAGSGLRGRMILFDGLWGETRAIATAARPGCAVCGHLPRA